MANLPAVVALKDVTEEFFLKSKLPRIEYANIKQLAIRAYQDLVFTIIPQGRVIVKSTMNANEYIAMPSDLVELNNVYIPGEDGQFWPLSKNRKIISTLSAGDIRNPDSPDYEGVDVPHPGGRWYQATGGVNLDGYYIDDFPNRRILFVNVDQSEVVLDYLSTGVDTTETAHVPVQVIGAMHAHMAYNFYAYQPNVPLSRLGVYSENLRRERQKVRNMRFNLEDFYQSILKTMSPSILR
jgi:hypothetical protein